jgi:hypothetical protein
LVLALVPLSVLAVGLRKNRAFRWSELARTTLYGLAMAMMLPALLPACPWLLRPMPGNPYAKMLAVPPGFQLALLFSMSLAAAWLGCRSARRVAVSG